MAFFNRKKRTQSNTSIGETAVEIHSNKKELCILVTEEDKNGRNIALMSDFFETHIMQLTKELNEKNALQTIEDIPPAYFGMMNEALCKFKNVFSGNITFTLDFNSLPTDILAKYKKGEYRLGESRQVEGNLRAVLVDKNGDRVKDLTLKKILTAPDTLDTTRHLFSQMQMQQINAKLANIQELQEFQIRTDWNERIVAPFLRARDNIKNAQDTLQDVSIEKYLEEAKRDLNLASSNVYTYIDTLSQDIGKLLSNNRFIDAIKNVREKSQKKFEQCMSMLTLGLQYATKIVGVQIQVYAYLGQTEAIENTLRSYYNIIDYIVNTPISKDSLSTCQILQNYFPYTEENKNCWLYFEQEIKQVLSSNLFLDSEKNYLITAEVNNEEEH